MNVDEFKRREVSRRQFLGRSAQQAAGVAVGVVGLTGVAAGAAKSAGATERVTLAVIGVRNQGRQLAQHLARLNGVEIRALCDVDESQFAPAVREVTDAGQRAPELVRDFRQILDQPDIRGVVIATPDHWHAPMARLACLAGKDVYLESPPTHSLAEDADLLEIVRNSSQVVQVGLQQRSGAHFQSAIAFVQSGQLGRVRLARAWIVHRRKNIGRRGPVECPAHIDYAAWLGSAPARPFQPNRFHFNWRWFWDYGGGELAHWGVHMLDVARWGLDVSVPQRVSAVGGKYSFDDDQETPDALSVQYDFGDRSILWEQRLWSAHGVEGRSSGVAFHGDQGTLVLDRGGWKVYDHGEVVASDCSDQLGTHLQNFVQCIRTRESPTADLATGLASGALCHWGNQSYRQGCEIRPAAESSPS